MGKKSKEVFDAIMKVMEQYKALKLEDLQGIMGYLPYCYSHALTKECAFDLTRAGKLVTNRVFTVVAINSEEFNKFMKSKSPITEK